MPSQLEITLANQIGTTATQTTLSLEELITNMKATGMSNTAIRQTLLNDLNNNGQIFGAFKNKIKSSVKNGVEFASNQESKKVWLDEGVQEFQWISVGDKSVCPDCEERHKEVGTMEFFDLLGQPKSGFSVCGSNCRCQVIPKGYKEENLDKPLLKGKEKLDVTRINMAGKHEKVKDSFAWMEKHGVVNNGFKKLPLDYANAITEAMSRLPKAVRANIIVGDFQHFQKAQGRKFRTPSSHNYGVSGEIRGADALESKLKEIKPTFEDAKRDNLPLFDPNYKKLPDYKLIAFNTRKYKSLDEITKRKESMNLSYAKAKGKNYNFNMTGEATVHHEFGHLVQEYLTSEQRIEWDKLAKEWIKTDDSEYLKIKQAFTEFHSEAFAEAWASYQTGQKSRLPKEIVEFIDNI